MNRAALEHLIRAAAVLTGQDDIVVLGSQAILGQFPAPPDELLVSSEADLYPRDRPELADLIEGSLGELSPFHDTFGYYAEGVDPGIATLPPGWQERLIPLRNENTRGATGWCLEVHDLLVAKLVAGREKDLRFSEGCARHGLARPETVRERLSATPLDPALRTSAEQRLARAFGGTPA